ncbi:MAG: glutathione S-transferase [Phyllobacteriaceae bacterium]|nr:glutathione S-transferase [Phyllobacteriaceae bacterium]
MKLWYSPASPFVRKCLIVAHERDLTDRIEIMDANANVVDPDMRIVQSNPAGKIPTMVLDDGQVLFDSRVICAWLDTLHDGKKLMPRSGSKRFEVMTLEALGDAIMDAAVSNRYETALRPPEYQWKAWSDGQMGKVKASLDQLEKQWIRSLGRNPNMGSIAVAAALGYLDFRYPDLNWRRGRPKLTRWFKRFGERPSFMETEPK